MTELDHLVLTAPSLESGRTFVESQFGVRMSPGGEHISMGTHNLLLKIGPRSYLEVISVNPDAPSPRRPRWFGLDLLPPGHQTELSTWILRSRQIYQDVLHTPWSPNCIDAMSRGTLKWLITIPSPESISENRMAPMLIQWGDQPHPADRLPDTGVHLSHICVSTRHTNALRTQLAFLELNSGPVAVEVIEGPDRLTARFATPRGSISLSSQLSDT